MESLGKNLRKQDPLLSSNKNTHCEIAMNDEFFVAGTYEVARQFVQVGFVNLKSFIVLPE